MPNLKTYDIFISHAWRYSDDYNRLVKREVVDFLEFLVEKNKRAKKRKSPKFGCCKGFFKMSPDFDEPLDDFREYM